MEVYKVYSHIGICAWGGRATTKRWGIGCIYLCAYGGEGGSLCPPPPSQHPLPSHSPAHLRPLQPLSLVMPPPPPTRPAPPRQPTCPTTEETHLPHYGGNPPDPLRRKPTCPTTEETHLTHYGGNPPNPLRRKPT